MFWRFGLSIDELQDMEWYFHIDNVFFFNSKIYLWIKGFVEA